LVRRRQGKSHDLEDLVVDQDFASKKLAIGKNNQQLFVKGVKANPA